MSIVRKSISLTKHQDDWVKAQISSGDYTNDSEVVRDLIRKAQGHDEDLQKLRAAIKKAVIAASAPAVWIKSRPT